MALPYHESDHVLGIAYNVLSGGTCLQDIEQRRQDEVYLDAWGAQRIPDPTTAGDFCRRFDELAIHALQAAINETRVWVWRTQPATCFDEAILDADGTLAETTGQCKKGIDIAHTGVWGYHPLMVSLAQTQNRSTGQSERQPPVGRGRRGAVRSSRNVVKSDVPQGRRCQRGSRAPERGMMASQPAPGAWNEVGRACKLRSLVRRDDLPPSAKRATC